MGTKHSSHFQVRTYKQGPERSPLNRELTDLNQIYSTPINNFQIRPNGVEAYTDLNRRQMQTTHYNYNCLPPPKPPRLNAENALMTGGSGTTSNRISSFTPAPFENENQNLNNSLNLRKVDSSIEPESSTSKQNLLQELLECPICMNLYDNPHVLPCQHTFCKNCIISLQTNETNNRSNTINCPICREIHVLQNGVEGLAANYTMKRLIELESINAAEREKNREKSKAKCFGCQKYAHLKVCVECSYMLCIECIENPDHDYIIEAKINSKKKYYAFKQDYYSPKKIYNPKDYRRQDVYGDLISEDLKLKLTLLCHSSALETSPSIKHNEELEDEYGKCKTFHKVGISANDRVITLKKIVEKKFSISTKDQILVYKDKILKSDLKPLSYYNLKQYSRIHVFDERDIKESTTDLEEDVYGIYQDTDLIQLDDTRKKNENSNTNSSSATSSNKSSFVKNKNFGKNKNMSASGSSQATDSSYENQFKKNNVTKSNTYKKGYDNSQLKRIDTKRSSSVINVRSYYQHHELNENKYATMSRYRRLDEIFDRQINIRDY